MTTKQAILGALPERPIDDIDGHRPAGGAPLRFAMLALLQECSNHGYAIHAAFEERLGDLWELNYGQVYQILTALERDGLIEGTSVQAGRRPPRRVYAISAEGRAAVRSWLLQPPPPRRSFRDEFYVRLLFAAQIGSTCAREVIEQHSRRCKERVLALRDQLACDKGITQAAIVRRLFTSAAILHAEADVAALESCHAAFGEATAGPEASSQCRAGVDRVGDVRRGPASRRTSAAR